MNSFLIALQFISSIPVKKKLNYSEKKIGQSMLFYPLIGTLIGLLICCINIIIGNFLPSMLKSSILLISFVLISGGLHLDGLADSFDGLFGGKNKENMLKIMADSYIGVYGVIVIVLILLTKFILIDNLPIVHLNYILILVPTISRWSMTVALYLFPYAKKEGFGKAFKLYFKKRQFVVATIWVLLVSISLFLLKGLLVLAISFLVTILIAKYITKKLGGLTGDNYGAINELMEITIMFLFILIY
ncbi:MAG: adenosylcobinamide-GDP ribazoletransferase [Halanaerobiales bacterium]|nr:adenosylcobinamide-GDP ribazoletransferase [Halanaerobiales bacterium]